MISHGLPYPGFRDPVVIRKTLAGERPKRPATEITTEEIWSITVRCWDTNPVSRPSATRLRRYLKALVTESAPPPLSLSDDPSKLKLAPELFDDSFISTPTPSYRPPSPSESAIVQRADPFDLNVPPLPPQYQLIPFPINISKTEQFLVHDTITFVFRGKRGIPLADALEKRCDGLDGRDSPTDSATTDSNSFTLRLRVCTKSSKCPSAMVSSLSGSSQGMNLATSR